MTTRKAPPRDVRWVAEMGEKFLLCRSLRHQWKPAGRFRPITAEERKLIRSTMGFTQLLKMELECLRCKAERIDLYGRNTAAALNGGEFVKLRAYYRYPKAYRFIGSEHTAERPMNSDYYKELFRRYGKAK